MNEKELINKIEEISESISPDNSWKQAAKAGMLNNLAKNTQNIKPPKNVARSMVRFSPAIVVLITLALATTVFGAIHILRSKSEFPDCEGAVPRKIDSIGATVRVVNALIPLRSEPNAETDNIVVPLPEGTLVKVVGKPVCTTYLDGANLWWYVRTEHGAEGYAAEGSAIDDIYYLEEIE